MIKFSELLKEEQKEVKSILNGNGMKIKEVNIEKSGSKIALEVKKTGQIIIIDWL